MLLPISIVGALVLVSQGVDPELRRTTPRRTRWSAARQSIALGPVASQEVIKELGTNGGGFFNANSAHPFENPTALSNFFEMLLILLIPAALTYTYGRMVGNRRQGWAIFSAMSILFVVGGRGRLRRRAARHAGRSTSPACSTHHFAGSTGGNLEGKEQRFGIANTALWAAITTVTSCGAVNGAFESLTGPRRRRPVLEPRR